MENFILVCTLTCCARFSISIHPNKLGRIEKDQFSRGISLNAIGATSHLDQPCAQTFNQINQVFNFWKYFLIPISVANCNQNLDAHSYVCNGWLIAASKHNFYVIPVIAKLFFDWISSIMLRLAWKIVMNYIFGRIATKWNEERIESVFINGCLD